MAAKQTYTVAVNAETKGAVRGLNNMNTALKAFISLAAAKQVLDFSKELVNATSTIETYNNKLRIITNSSKQFADTQKMLVRLAGETRSGYSDVLDLFSKLKVSTEALGISSDRVAKVTGNLSKALVVAGADGNTAASVIRQFGQAMASGEVRGDEFRSLVEGLGPALAVMARETGITVGELRRMSQAGELNAEVMFEMIENSTALTAAFGQMEETIQNVETAFGDSKLEFMGFIGEVSGISDLYKEMLKDTMRFMDRMSGREGSIALVEDEDLANILGANGALKELESRYNKIFDLFEKNERGEIKGDIFGLISPEQRLEQKKGEMLGTSRVDEVDVIFDLIRALKEKAKVEDAAAEDMRRLNVIREETNQLIAKINKGSGEQMKLLQKNAKLDFGTPFEKAQAATRAHGDAVRELEHQITQLSRLEDDELGIINAKIEQKIKLLNESNAVYHELIKAEAEAFFKQQESLDAAQEKIDAEIEANEKAQAARLAAAKDLEREIMLMSEFDAKQQALNDINEEARLIRVDIADAIDDQIKKQQLLEQVETNRIHKIKELEADLEEERKKQAQAEIDRAFDVNKKNFAVLGKYSKMAFQLSKAIQIAEALMGARQAALGAYAATVGIPFVGPVLAPIAMAASYAATAATVAGIANQQFPGRAGGGPVSRGQPYIVGEAGSEMFVPSQNGTIVSNSDMGGRAVNVNFNIDTTDAEGFDELLVTRKNLIVSMVRQAVGQGRLA
jgi:tape measure domain-containing protein